MLQGFASHGRDFLYARGAADLKEEGGYGMFCNVYSRMPKHKRQEAETERHYKIGGFFTMNMTEVTSQSRQAVTEILAGAHLHPGAIFVIGCSSSEVLGQRIGTATSLEAA